MIQSRVVCPRRPATVFMFCLTLSIIACDDRGTDVFYWDREGVAVRVGQSSMSITNNSSRTIHIFAIERRAQEYTDWLLGCDSNKAIQTGSAREIPYSKIFGYYKECEVGVFWWNCPPMDGQRERFMHVRTP